jgi:NADH-quinone oxidoreductase subunit H
MNTGVDRWVYNLAPILAVMSVILLWAVVPFSDAWIGTDLSIGVLYLIAVGALGTVAVIMAGWGSNNKYSLLAAFRSVAQLISYEVPMVIAMLIPVLMAGTMSTQQIIEQQYIAYGFAIPLTMVIFLISGQAETGRGPFDLLEAESEIVAGFHTEYTGMKFGMFMVTEFLHAFTVAVLATILYLGGWRIPFVPAEDTPALIGFFVLMAKSIVVYLVLIWVRLTLPRLRIDHLLDFNWKFLVPLSLVNLLVVAFVWKIVPGTDEINSAEDQLVPTIILLASNVAMILVVGALLRGWGRRDRERIEAHRAPVEASVAEAGD